jgi:peptide deformylase
MTILKILEFPDERLRKVAQPVLAVNDSIRRIADDMLETMYDAPGVGLAATQVDIHQRIVVMDVSLDKTEPLVLINPEIVDHSGLEVMEEGCLSFPDVFAKVERAEKVTLKALDRNGEEFTIEADELLAVCIQHELDHLMGKLFVDYLSPLKRQRIRNLLEKRHRKSAKQAL